MFVFARNLKDVLTEEQRRERMRATFLETIVKAAAKWEQEEAYRNSETVKKVHSRKRQSAKGPV